MDIKTTSLLRQSLESTAYRTFSRHPYIISPSAVSTLVLDPSRDSIDDTRLPIFVLLPSLPLSEERFHIFEPRYRLMLQHCLGRDGPAGQAGEFGMCWPVQGGSYSSVGTLLRVQEHTVLPDGRFDIKCVGVRRFRVLDRGSVSELETSTNSMASYNCATVEWFDDEDEKYQLVSNAIPIDESKTADEARNQLVKLHDTLLRAYKLPEAKDLLSRMHDSDIYDEIVDRLDASKSLKVVINAPVEESQLSWWLLSRLVPLPPDVKASLIMSQSISRRLAEATQLLENLYAAFIDHLPDDIELV